MRDIRPSAEYMNEIMHQVKVSTSISPNDIRDVAKCKDFFSF